MDPNVIVAIAAAGGAVAGAALTTLGSWLSTRANRDTTRMQLAAAGRQQALDRVHRDSISKRDREEQLRDHWRQVRTAAHLRLMAILKAHVNDVEMFWERLGNSTSSDRPAPVEPHPDIHEALGEVEIYAGDASQSQAKATTSTILGAVIFTDYALYIMDEDPVRAMKFFPSNLTESYDLYVRTVREELGVTI